MRKSLEDTAQYLSDNSLEQLLAIAITAVPFLIFWPDLQAFSSPRNLSGNESQIYTDFTAPSTPGPSNMVAMSYSWLLKFKLYE